MGTYLTGTYSVIHNNNTADFDNFIYSELYFTGSGPFIINGTSVAGTAGRTLDIIVNKSTTLLNAGFLLLGNPIAPQTKVGIGEYVNIKNGNPIQS